jgi:hypothetical protein
MLRKCNSSGDGPGLRRERCTTNSMRGLRRRHPVSVRRPGFATHMPAAFHCVAIRRDVTSTLSVTRSVTQCTRRPARHAAYAASAAKSPDGWVTSGCGTYATTSGSHGAILRSRSSTSWTCFPTPPGRGCMWATPRDIRRPTSSRATSACAASMSFIPWVGMPTVCRRALCGTHRSPSGHHHKAKHRDLPFAAEAAGLLIRVLLFGIPFMRPEPGGLDYHVGTACHRFMLFRTFRHSAVSSRRVAISMPAWRARFGDFITPWIDSWRFERAS